MLIVYKFMEVDMHLLKKMIHSYIFVGGKSIWISRIHLKSQVFQSGMNMAGPALFKEKNP